MMRKRRNTGLGVLAILGALATAAPTAASADCFDRSRPRLPTFDSVQAHLTNGASGQDVYRAVADGDAARVEVLIAADPSLLSTRTELPEGVRPSNGNSADLLTAAVARCDLAMVETLLRLGADPDGAIPGLALTYAILADELDLATVLLEGGAAPDAHDAGLSTPLHEALMFERADAVTLLASYGADVNRPDARGGIPLGTALSGQNWPEALALIEAGANPWQVHLEGILPAYMILISEPGSRADRRIREALLERIEAGAPIWPPVDSTIVRTRVLDGSWPTPAMRAAGFVVSDEALRRMRAVSN
jgi:hypothetical protein